MVPLLLGALNVVTARVSIPGTGVWIADLDIDLGLDGVVPSGRSILTVGTTPLSGTIDPRMTGKFGTKAHVRLVGGGGGWDTIVAALHLHNDFGIFSQAVLSQTAAEIGESVVDATPTRLGTDWVRTAGPAVRVLAGRQWYVDFTGVTIIGPRAPTPVSPSVDVLEWDPTTRRAELASDDLIVPGTLLVDTRFGTATVRDIEQTFEAGSARVIAWCETGETTTVPGAPTEPSGGRLVRALSALAREASGAAYLRRYRYRVVTQGADKRVTLQIVQTTRGAPELLKDVDVWPGVASFKTTFAPGTNVLVVFVDGDAAQPIVVDIAPDAPPPVLIEVGALVTQFGSGAHPVALAPAIATWMAAVVTVCAAHTTGPITIPPPPAAMTSTHLMAG